MVFAFFNKQYIVTSVSKWKHASHFDFDPNVVERSARRMNNTVDTHTLIYTQTHIPMSHQWFSSFEKTKRTINEGHFTELTTFSGMSCVQHPKPKMSLTHNFICSSKCPKKNMESCIGFNSSI